MAQTDQTEQRLDELTEKARESLRDIEKLRTQLGIGQPKPIPLPPPALDTWLHPKR